MKILIGKVEVKCWNKIRKLFRKQKYQLRNFLYFPIWFNLNLLYCDQPQTIRIGAKNKLVTNPLFITTFYSKITFKLCEVSISFLRLTTV